MPDEFAPLRERREDGVSATHIEHALALQHAQGKDAAMAFLATQGIAQHVIIRVLACAAFRRKQIEHRPVHGGRM